MDNKDFLEYGRKVLQMQSFSRLLGTELISVDTEKETIELGLKTDPEKHGQQHGFIHGGVLSYLADNSLTYAGGLVFPDVLTAEFKINYLKPVKGDLLIAKAKVVSKGKSQMVCESRIFSVQGEEEKLVAIAIGTIALRQSNN